MVPSKERSQNVVCHPATPSLIAGCHPPAFGYDADIIILTHHRFDETIEAVRSALQQQNVTLHVSVLDQGSPPDLQNRFAACFAGQRNFGYYTVPCNLGVGGGRNFLSGLGSGSVIVGLDNDAVFADDLVVARALAMLEASPDLGAIGFKILARDGVQLDEFSWGYPQRLKPFANGSFACTTFVGAGHAIRRKTWIAAGGYDADLFFTWEEYDFALRAIALHWRISYAGSLAVIHKISPGARVRWQSERMRLFVRNRLMIARKWEVSWLQLLPRIIGYMLKAARNRKLSPALSGLFEAIMADLFLLKKSPVPHMRHYLRENEGRFRDNFVRSFYLHVVQEMRHDPEMIGAASDSQAALSASSEVQHVSRPV